MQEQDLLAVGDDDKARLENEKLAEALAGLVARMQIDAEDRVSHRRPQEQEWIRDLEAFHGKYDPPTAGALNDKRRRNKSKLFMGKTGEKTRAWISRIEDILFPTDDKNWGIQPTPVPALSRMADAAIQERDQQAKQAMQGDPNAVQAMGAAEEAVDRVNAVDQEARDRCDLMQTEMEDQLQECRYNAASRDAIESACKLGTGIKEGPVTNERVRRGWKEDENGNFTLKIGGDPRPAFYNVDIWNFFPSKAATCIEDSEGFYIRHVWTKKNMREFAKITGVAVDLVRELVRIGPQDSCPDYMHQIRALTPEGATSSDRVFIVWKYVGPLSSDDMLTLALATGDRDTAKEAAEADPLQDMNAVVWFCAGKVLKFAIYPLDSGEPTFSRFCFEKDEGSFWGYGVPRLARDPQKAINAALRMMMDNSEVSSASQLFVDTNRIRSADGSDVITGGTIWQPKADAINTGFTGKEMYSVDIPSHQAELANIIEICLRWLDEVTMTPQLAQGEQGTDVTETAQGMALLMNAANIMTKRVIKNYDDDMTVPEIRRLYDWNMQFNPRREIKGDYAVDARGSSVLLVREMQARNLLVLLQLFAGDPEIKSTELKREVFRAHLLPANRFVKSDTEIKADAANVQEDPMIALKREEIEVQRDKIQADTAIAEMTTHSREQEAQLKHETAMMTLAETMNMSQDQIEAMISGKKMEIRAKERSMAVEAALRASPNAPENQTQIANT